MNCIVICCDTFRYDALAGKDVKTPNLDRLLERGVSFTNAYAEGLPTIQARRTMFTGRRSYPWRYEMDSRGLWPAISGWHRIPAEQDTLSELLLENGYTTGMVSDTYHMFKPTQNFTRGFASWQLIRGQESDNYRSGPLSKVDTAPYHPEGKNDRNSHLTQYLMNMLDRQGEEDYLPAKVFRSAVRWIEDNAENLPFFLWVDSFAPHEYWDPPMEFADAYYATENSKNYIVPQWLNGRNPSKDEIERTKALYKGYVTFVDKWIGHLFRKLDQAGLWDDTMVIFTSDHGTELWDKGRFGKSGELLYSYNAQVPLVIADPRTERRNATCAELAQHLDLLPTICSGLGIEHPDDIDGCDLAPAINDGARLRDRAITGWSKSVSVHSKEWNLVFDATDPAERTVLFNLQDDPEETADVSANHGDVVKEYMDFVKETLNTEIPIPIYHRGDRRQSPPKPVYRR
jgi:arylsulfatase A-like enzyme